MAKAASGALELGDYVSLGFRAGNLAKTDPAAAAPLVLHHQKARRSALELHSLDTEPDLAGGPAL
jgi:hypothetical protein